MILRVVCFAVCQIEDNRVAVEGTMAYYMGQPYLIGHVPVIPQVPIVPQSFGSQQQAVYQKQPDPLSEEKLQEKGLFTASFIIL